MTRTEEIAALLEKTEKQFWQQAEVLIGMLER